MIGRMLSGATAALTLLLALSACGGGNPPPAVTAVPPTATAPPTAELAETAYKLGSGDRVRVVVFRHEDLSGEFALDGAGKFAMPLVGEVEAFGLNTRELEQRIGQKLQDGYIIDPQVSVEVLNYRPFYILGEVKAPGSYQFVNGMNVLNAVALAGGFTYRAKQSDFVLQRGGSNTAGTDVGIETPILPGDIITVKERFF
jgi:protein involved in polysaccharide export with SLBB domain